MTLNAAHSTLGGQSNTKSLTITITGATLNLILILIMNYFYSKIAEWLTDRELHRCETLLAVILE